ncbi:hypothetical protein P8X24_10935 [Pyrococcus kukulkanii]|uniref:hypothetical protein n=1 Tax=Pyrococcus kukulkanii TaxID=1609559 RepID=UPI00356ABBE2
MDEGRNRPYVLEPSAWEPLQDYIKEEPLFVPEEFEEVNYRIEGIEEGLRKSLERRDLPVFSEVGETEESKGIVVDFLAFYVPYHYSRSDWGIYLRLPKILGAFKGIVRNYGAYIGISNIGDVLGAFTVFLAYIYWHELTHHIVEDICSMMGANYPVLSRQEEEGLAEWHAFVTAERRLSLPYRPYRRLNTAIISRGIWWKIPNPGKEARRKILSAIYYYFRRDKDPIYKPIVRDSVVKKLGLLWTPVREASVRGGYAYLVDSREEVYHRVYWTIY